ncbi:MAG: hypothetical protein ACRELY_17105 [Polyangiaceae bacterium]
MIAAGLALAAIAAFGIYLALGEKSHRHHHDDGLPEESDSAPMRGTDWNGPVGMPTSQESAGLPQPIATASDTSAPSGGVVPPPLSAIPQPTIAPPLDENVTTVQRARAIQMVQNRLISLQKEADAADQRGATDEAAQTRVRIARMTARLAELQDGGAQ